MKAARSMLWLTVAFYASACTPLPNPAPWPPRDVDVDVNDGADAPDAEPDAAPRTACGRACAVLARYACVESTPTAQGSSCAQVCERARAFPGMELPTACVARATSKQEVRKCGVCK